MNPSEPMNRIHVLGRKNHGKTQLVVELVEEFTRRGLRVGAIKHTHHSHELDTPGKDSYRHRAAGAAAVGIVSRGLCAVFLPVERMPVGQDRYEALAPAFSDCDLVVVEGDLQTTAAKIEVWRAVQNTAPLACEDPSILAVVTDDPLEVGVPVLPRADVAALADWILDGRQAT